MSVWNNARAALYDECDLSYIPLYNHKSKKKRVVNVYSSCILQRNALAIRVNREFEGKCICRLFLGVSDIWGVQNNC